MPNQNLVNATIDAATMTALEAVPGQIYALLPWLLTLTNAERQHLRKMGPKHTGYVAAVYAALNAHKDVMPTYKNFADFTTDKLLEEQMPYVIQLFEGILEKLKDTDLRLRHELIKHADAGYKSLVDAAKEGNLEVKAAAESIANSYLGKGKSKIVPFTTIAEKSSMVINNVIIGSTFTNTGETVLLINDGSETISGVKKPAIAVNPGNSIKIPKGYSSILVTNKSQDASGSFVVKTRQL